MSFGEFSSWVSRHETLLTLVALPVIFFLLTSWLAGRTDRQATKDRATDRELKKEIRLAEFRLSALNEFRRDFSSFLTGLRNWRLKNVPSHEEVNGRFNTVFLQLDRESAGFDRFVELSESLMEAPDFPIFAKGYEELKQIAADHLQGNTTNIEARLERADKGL